MKMLRQTGQICRSRPTVLYISTFANSTSKDICACAKTIKNNKRMCKSIYEVLKGMYAASRKKLTNFKYYIDHKKVR